MNDEQKQTFVLDWLLSTVLITISILGALIAAGLVWGVQAVAARKQRQRESRNASARRLRWTADDSEVEACRPVIKPRKAADHEASYPMAACSEQFHIFLSHV